MALVPGAGKEAPHLYCFLPIVFMVQVVVTICTVAVIAEFTVCKTVTIPETEDAEGICKHDHYIGVRVLTAVAEVPTLAPIRIRVTLCSTPQVQSVPASLQSQNPLVQV